MVTFSSSVKSKLSFGSAFLALQIGLWEKKKPTKPDNEDLKGAQKSAS